MADIFGHPWMQGPVASVQDISAEFANRKAQIDKKKEAERTEKQAGCQETNQTRAGVRRGVAAGGNTYRNDGQVDEESKDQPNIVTLKFGKFSAAQTKKT